MKVNSQSAAATAGASGPKINTALNGKESVGDVANRVANSGKPSSRRVQGQGSPQLDKDAFFKLMLAQVKNQDPTNPVKNHEMAAQLAQFSSLEQMSNVNETLKVMQKGQGEGMQFQAIDLIGKTVRGDNSKINRAQGDNEQDLNFNLKEAASDVQISIANSKGEIIKKLSVQNVPQGAGKAIWDGKEESGALAPPGSYKISVDAKNANGQKVSTESEFSGKVTGVQFSEAGPIVSIGKKMIPLKDIKSIEESVAPVSAQNSPVGSVANMSAASLQKMIPSSGKMDLPTGAHLPSMDIASLNNNLNQNLKSNLNRAKE